MIRVAQLKRRKSWIVIGLPWPTCRWCGPYDNKREAMSDMRGLCRFIRYEWTKTVQQTMQKARGEA